MAKEPEAKNRIWSEKLLGLLPGVGQFAILVAVAVAILRITPFTSDQLTAIWAGSDLPRSHWPTALLIQRSFPQVPLWNPYYAGGQPLAADPLAALFYPPTHLVHFFSLRDYYVILITGHLVFAGLGMLLLARRALRLPRLPALVAAVAFMATPRLIGHLGAGHITIVQTVAWFPWLALACWATIREPRRWSLALGVCFAMTLLAGHPQIAYYALLMTAGLAAWLLIQLWRTSGWRSMLKPIAGLVGAGIVGVLVAAVFLLPLAEFTAYSTRQKEISSGDTFPLLDFLKRLFIQPPPQGVPWEVMITPGLAVLALVTIAFVLHWRKTWPLLLGIALVAGLALGNASPLYIVAAHILPGFDRFRSPARIWFIALVPITLLAGIGTGVLIQAVRRISRPASLAFGLLAVLVVAFTLVRMDHAYTKTGSVSSITVPSQLARTASQLAGSGRIYDVQDDNISQATAVLMQTRLASGWNPLMIQSYVEYIHSAGDYEIAGYQLHIPRYDAPQVQPKAKLLGWMNVSVVISRRLMTDPHLTFMGKVDGVYIYKNTLDAGPAYLVNLVSPASNGAAPSLDAMQKINVPIHTITQTPEQETYIFTSNTQAYLVLAEPTFPGWTARLDGNIVSPQIVGGTMPAIQVSPGTHTLSYSYAPSSVRNGAILSAIGLIVMFAWLLTIVFWKPRKRQASVEEIGEEDVKRGEETLVVPTNSRNT